MENPQARADFLLGLHDFLPQSVGQAPWALVTGTAMAAAGFGPAKAIILNFVAYAATAQLAMLPLYVLHAPIWVIFLTAMVVNLRFVIYSASVRKLFDGTGLLSRTVAAYAMSDRAFGLLAFRERQGHALTAPRAYYSGASTGAFLSWHSMATVGVLVGARIPPAWQIDFAGTLALIAMLGPFLRDSHDRRAAIVAAVVAIAALTLPYNLGLVAAVLAGLAAGAWPRYHHGQ